MKHLSIETSVENVTGNHQLIDSLIHKWGGPISEAIFEAPCHFFQVPDIEGFIGYSLQSGCAVIYGEPVCSPEDKLHLALAFHHYCQQHKLESIYICVSEHFAKLAIKNGYKVLIEVGENIVLDPTHNPMEGSKGYRLRNRTHHASKLGLNVYEYIVEDKAMEEAIQNVGNTWLKARHGPQIHLGEINFFDHRNGKRWFYVENKEKEVIGTALLSRLDAHEGWLLKYLMVVPDTPRGTSELMMTHILKELNREGCCYITYGMVPGENLGEIIGLSRYSAYLARGGFKLAKWIFHLEQRKLYWQKYHPQTEPCYVLFSSPRIGLKQIRALLSALKIT